MTVGFRSITTNQECSFCLDTQEGGKVAHYGRNGEKHPFHPECIEVWLSTHSTCPGCEIPLDNNNLISLKGKIIPLKDRMIQELKLVAKDALTGVAVSAIAGVCVKSVSGITQMIDSKVIGTTLTGIATIIATKSNTTWFTGLTGLFGAALLVAAGDASGIRDNGTALAAGLLGSAMGGVIGGLFQRHI